MVNLDQLEPSEEARQKAKAAGLDLDVLKLEQPETFMMLVSEPLMRVGAELKDRVADVFSAAFPQHRLIELSQADMIQLNAFPALTKHEVANVLSALGRLLEHPKFEYPMAYLRTVQDKTGIVHECALPLTPADWSGHLNRLIGPFASEEEAQAWASAQRDQANRAGDSLPHKDRWFYEFFPAS